MRGLELKLADAREMLTGDPTRSRRVVPMPLSIERRARHCRWHAVEHVRTDNNAAPRLRAAHEQYEEVSQTLKELIEVEFVQLQEKLDQAGVTWTPGRRIPQLDKQPRDNGGR